jgi:hypothetical protein
MRSVLYWFASVVRDVVVGLLVFISGGFRSFERWSDKREEKKVKALPPGGFGDMPKFPGEGRRE